MLRQKTARAAKTARAKSSSGEAEKEGFEK
jgi:hypothetical protein